MKLLIFFIALVVGGPTFAQTDEPSPIGYAAFKCEMVNDLSGHDKQITALNFASAFLTAASYYEGKLCPDGDFSSLVNHRSIVDYANAFTAFCRANPDSRWADAGYAIVDGLSPCYMK